MFALPMTAEGKDLTVNLKPFSLDQARAIAPYWRHQLVRYLGRNYLAQTEDTQASWYERMIDDRLVHLWGIYVDDGTEEVHVGSTSLGREEGHSQKFVSGILIWRPEYHGRGVATASHLARTFYAVDHLNAIGVRSMVFHNNEASRRAIERVGYVKVGDSFHESYVEGEVQHAANFQWVNPLPRAWDYFWGSTQVPEYMQAGRPVAMGALSRANRTVKYM